MPGFSILFPSGGCIMGCHVVHLFCCAVNLDGLTAFSIANRAGFFFIVWLLYRVFGGVFLEYFALFRRVTGAMQQACFSSGRPIARMAYIFCLALASADLLGVGRRGGFYSLSFPAMNSTVGIFPYWCFRRCSPFVEFPRLPFVRTCRR